MFPDIKQQELIVSSTKFSNCKLNYIVGFNLCEHKTLNSYLSCEKSIKTTYFHLSSFVIKRVIKTAIIAMFKMKFDQIK